MMPMTMMPTNFNDRPRRQGQRHNKTLGHRIKRGGQRLTKSKKPGLMPVKLNAPATALYFSDPCVEPFNPPRVRIIVMGLDMHLYGEKYFFHDWDHPENDRTEDGVRVAKLHVELGYWRKHPNLHGWIVQNFAAGRDDCQEIEFVLEQLDQLIEAVTNRELPPTSGFFFGESACDDEERDNDLTVLRRAREWLTVPKEKGVYRTLVYRASW
jgi:hypothetical protein